MKPTYYIPALCMLITSCSLKQEDATPLHLKAQIYPDFSEVTMPCNIAPPTFALCDSLNNLSDLQAIFKSKTNEIIVGCDNENGFCISPDDWHKLIESANVISVTIQGYDGNKWVEYDPFSITISADTINSYLSYRLIEPGYEVWNEMGIYQRNLGTYDEEAILTNKANDGGCMNCHSFCNRDASTMSLHLRKNNGGTYIVKNGKTDKLTPSPSFTYPSWHPGGRYIAYSLNDIKQMFHTTDINRIEVFDYRSDVIVYDTQSGEVLTCPQLHSPLAFETFPSWSSDGKSLYYCTADSVDIPAEYDKAHYSLCRISFDESTGKFGDKIDTLYNARILGGSISFPRESPDGKWLMYTHHGYGNFSIWHKDADLWMQPTTALHPVAEKDIIKLESPRSDSYHSWSSTGKWVVFSSRREDGLYTRPYLMHWNGKTFTKPCPIPQETAIHDKKLLKSYNIPEFTTNAFTAKESLKDAIK